MFGISRLRRGLEMLVTAETKLKGKGEFKCGKRSKKISTLRKKAGHLHQKRPAKASKFTHS